MRPYDLTLDQDTGLARISFSVRARYEQVEKALSAVVEDGDFIADRRLWDFRESGLSLTNAELQRIGAIAQAYSSDGRGRTAVLVSRDVDYGQARVFHVYRETPGNPVRVFRDEAEALAWLMEEEGEGEKG